MTAQIERYGFVPAGGGKFTILIEPAEKLLGLEVLQRGQVLSRRVQALVAQLPLGTARRECDELESLCQWPPDCFSLNAVPSPGPGNILMMELECEQVTELFASQDRMGVSSERIARELWDEARKLFATDIPIGPYLADRLILPCGIAASQGMTSQFRTCRLRRHSTTHLDLLQRFLPIQVAVIPEAERSCLVKLGPKL